MNFGFSWWREQDHYYNGVLGWPAISLGLASTDPAINAFTASSMGDSNTADIKEAQELYAVLVGRINAVTGSYTYDQKTNSYGEGQIGAYNLDEVQKSYGLFFQDSYRLRPNLTLNYGLRWDAIYPDQDVTHAYHSALDAAIWGPSGIGNLFNPGSLKGTNNPMITQQRACEAAVHSSASFCGIWAAQATAADRYCAGASRYERSPSRNSISGTKPRTLAHSISRASVSIL